MNLHQQFVKLGNERRKFTNELLALLPEIYQKGIYKKYAATIVEYAGKFGGLSKGVVLKRLRLEKYLSDKPKLKEAIRTEGVHKVALVASLATVENEAAWADKVRNMSKPAIQELSKEVRWKMEMNCKTTLCGTAPQRIKIEMDGELFFMFLKLKKKYGEKLTNREVIKKIFEENLDGNFQGKFQDAKSECKNDRVQNLENTEIAKNCQPQPVKSIPGDNFEGESTRYIPAEIKRKIIASSHGFCTYPSCNRPAKIFHHKDRFASTKSHESVIHLCKIHHEFMHNGLVENEEFEKENWNLQLGEAKLQKIDSLYREYRLDFLKR